MCFDCIPVYDAPPTVIVEEPYMIGPGPGMGMFFPPSHEEIIVTDQPILYAEPPFPPISSATFLPSPPPPPMVIGPHSVVTESVLVHEEMIVLPPLMPDEPVIVIEEEPPHLCIVEEPDMYMPMSMSNVDSSMEFPPYAHGPNPMCQESFPPQFEGPY